MRMRARAGEQELARLADGEAVYKLVGPVLVKKDVADARGNVDKRLEFLAGEIARLGRQVDEAEAKLRRRQQTVVVAQQVARQRSGVQA